MHQFSHFLIFAIPGLLCFIRQSVMSHNTTFLWFSNYLELVVLPYLPLKNSQFLNSFVFIILVSFTMLLKCILILCWSWVPIYYVSHCFIKFFTKYSLCQNLLAPAVCLYLATGTRFCATAMHIQLFSSRLQVSTKPIIFPQLSFLLQLE